MSSSLRLSFVHQPCEMRCACGVVIVRTRNSTVTVLPNKLFSGLANETTHALYTANEIRATKPGLLLS